MRLFSKPEYNIRLCGPAQSGKTSLLYRLRYGKFYPNIAERDAKIERVPFKESCLLILDGRDASTKSTSMLRKTVGSIFVVDGADNGRLRVANRLLREQAVAAKILLILVTKSDKPGFMSVDAVKKSIDFDSLDFLEAEVFECSAVTGEGVLEGVAWLRTQLALTHPSSCPCSCAC